MEKSYRPITTQCSQLILLLITWVLLSCYLTNYPSSVVAIESHGNIMCHTHEREALLKFKQGIQIDFCGLMSSWGDHEDDNKNCCQWYGVRCSNQTSHVIELSLHGVVFTYDYTEHSFLRCLQGKLSSSLVDLKHLSYLDLSFNNFSYQPIPTFIGSLANLKHLNLACAGFIGEIPHQLGNLSRLTSLDLESENSNTLYVKNLSWLSKLTLLRYINLSWVDLSEATEWLQIVNNLSFLRFLLLDNCELPPSLPFTLSSKNTSTTLSVLTLKGNHLNSSIFQWLFNLSTIAHVELSDNNLQGIIPSSLGDMQSLTYLDLSSNLLEDPIPDTISNIKPLTHLILHYNKFQTFPNTHGNLCRLQELNLQHNNLTDELSNIIHALSGCATNSLQILDLSYNQIWGQVPNTIDMFSSLTYLSLSDNQLNGTISVNLGKLSMLVFLDLDDNFLKGMIFESHFSSLSRLKELYLSNNRAIALNIDADWVPPFQLDTIVLDSCRLGPSFPKWLSSLKNYSYLDISDTGISDTIPNSFWNSLPFTLLHLNVSHNKIYGTLSNLAVHIPQGFVIDISFNNIKGAIPSFPTNLAALRLNNNRLTDPLPFLCPKTKIALSYLDLSNNLLTGELPDCWMNFDQLLILHLESNSFSGSIPPSIGYLKQLESLHLHNNIISGQLPRSLENLTSLIILDLGHNSLSGHIPPAIGNNMTSLAYLSLRSNSFVGGIPVSLCQLSSLQILDLSNNNIIGTIPRCICNLTGMQNGTGVLFTTNFEGPGISSDTYIDAATVMWKRKEWSFGYSLGLIKAIDFSNNNLGGEIPIEISSLGGLVFLNLSRNTLSGSITPKLGQLTALQFLDLSNNHLSGEIPASFTNLSFLEILDVSNNQLCGKIPYSTQLQGFDVSTYAGNPGLCGLPLPTCPEDQPPVNNDNIIHSDENGNDDSNLGLYISIVLGFIIGFWGVCGTLVLKRSWRHAFFRFFDDTRDKLYAMVSVNVARIKRRF